MRFVLVVFLFLGIPGVAVSDHLDLDFTLHRLESGVPGPTLLVVGGIQGDEPGGFTAASLLVTSYDIRSGSVWVIPNLNFESIVKRSRGVYGDMNRKFSHIDEDDPDYEAIQKVKQIILDERVDLVLNLHDGSGFFRHESIDRWRNPRRWGQCVVIDQEAIGESSFERLGEFARTVIERVNANVPEDEHRYRVKNTKTRLGDVEMEKTLTYFAIRHGKPAHGVEASKSLPMHERAFYHLNVLEAYMDELGISYERGFQLSAAGVEHQIDRDVKLSLYDNKILLDVANARKRLNYVPLKKGSPIEFKATNPLVAVFPNKRHFKVSYGNRSVTQLRPQYFDYDDSLDNAVLYVDGGRYSLPLGSVIDVRDEFTVEPMEGYRVNIIGFRRKGLKNETAVPVGRKDFARRFSVDQAGSLFRVEFYRDEKFSGMVLVRFVDGEPKQTTIAGNLWPDQSRWPPDAEVPSVAFATGSEKL